MLTIYIYSRRLHICSYIDSEVGCEVAAAVKPNPTLLGGGVLRLSSPPAAITPGSPMECPGTAPTDCPEPGCPIPIPPIPILIKGSPLTAIT